MNHNTRDNQAADPEHLRYPIGKFVWSGDIESEQRQAWIAEIAALPALLRAAVSGMSEEQLDTPYRDGGWTVRQVVHHVPDSHMNSYIRFKLALTEDKPTIRPYYEDRWAELADYSGPAEVSLALLDALHERWVKLLGSMGDADYARSFIHPESGDEIRLDYNLGAYAWHGRHHLAQITELAKRRGWQGKS
ncbi:YfiT family bacillithiol transferase [Paenibacillus glycinis]|uniref:Putative metal-dependent hydrolase GT019_23530 n=1 Tax=Paenibacillus glycinis TaxID=2697035 RepID=A0ABW9XVY6_9BACL|nr:bacillithiol transferase BstA [Paenibacillus glycinis]NBD26855.1 bacillithiol transferase BstA [Paenibacillus glycinis]